MQSYKRAIKLMQTKPKLTDTQGRENTHNLTAILRFWYEFDQKQSERVSELGTGPRVKWFSQSRSVMFSSYKRVMCNILCHADILRFPGSANVDFRARD